MDKGQSFNREAMALRSTRPLEYNPKQSYSLFFQYLVYAIRIVMVVRVVVRAWGG